MSVKERKVLFSGMLAGRIPRRALAPVVNRLCRYDLEITLKKPRISKSGDYRPPWGRRRYHRISINDNLNPYSFLITLLHEMAHMITWEKYRNKALPHGEEWKREYSRLVKELIASGTFPRELSRTLTRHVIEVPATCNRDVDLYKVLRKYDREEPKMFLEELPHGSVFRLGKKWVFKKGRKLRKRYRCMELRTKREYFVSPVAEVEPR